MQFGLTSFVVALLLFGPAAAVEFHFYKYATLCGGPARWSVYDAVKEKCYTWGDLTSVGIHFVPSGAKAQVYRGSNGCSDYVTEGAAGYSCLKGGTINSANWFYPFKKLVRKTPKAEPKFSVTYEQPDGAFREVEVPSGHVARALNLVDTKDYDALAEFPTVSVNWILWLIICMALDSDIMTLHS